LKSPSINRVEEIFLNEMSLEVEMFIQIVAVKDVTTNNLVFLPLKVRPKLVKKYIENIEENEYLC
jgi:hypothetical protein